MVQYLYLLRHAHALDDAPSDELRPLSPKGHRQCDRLVKGFSSNQLLKVEAIWQSGLLRATETAEALANGLQIEVPREQKDGLTPFDHPSEIATKLHETSESCLIAGHEPNLSCLASFLLTGGSAFQRITFAKASLLCLSRMKVGQQSTPWQIEWHLSHKHFK